MHPDPKLLASYAERRLRGTEELESHLADCPDCREEVRILAPPAPVRLWIPAAAAALIAAAFLLWPRREPPLPRPAPAPAEGSWRLPGGDRAQLDRGSRADRLSDALFELRQGRLWLDTGSPRAVRVPGWGEVRASDAEIVVEVASSSGVSWIPEAFADQTPEVRVFLRRGACAILREDGAPQSAVRGEEAFAWVSAGAIPAGLERLPGGDYRLSVSVRPRKTSGDVGLAFPARTRCPFWVLPLQADRWTRLEVERRGSRIRLWRDGDLASTLDAGVADAMTPSAHLPGLKVWGADVESRDLRLLEWPE